MSDARVKGLLLVLAFAIQVAGCRTMPTEHDRAARIIDPDNASRSALQCAVNDALHTNVTLADDALTKSSVLIIERSPPRSMQGLPAQGRNTELPIQFRLVINGEDCVLIDQRDRSRRKLDNTRCQGE